MGVWMVTEWTEFFHDDGMGMLGRYIGSRRLVISDDMVRISGFGAKRLLLLHVGFDVFKRKNSNQFMISVLELHVPVRLSVCGLWEGIGEMGKQSKRKMGVCYILSCWDNVKVKRAVGNVMGGSSYWEMTTTFASSCRRK